MPTRVISPQMSHSSCVWTSDIKTIWSLAKHGEKNLLTMISHQKTLQDEKGQTKWWSFSIRLLEVLLSSAWVLVVISFLGFFFVFFFLYTCRSYLLISKDFLKCSAIFGAAGCYSFIWKEKERRFRSRMCSWRRVMACTQWGSWSTYSKP